MRFVFSSIRFDLCDNGWMETKNTVDVVASVFVLQSTRMAKKRHIGTASKSQMHGIK